MPVRLSGRSTVPKRVASDDTVGQAISKKCKQNTQTMRLATTGFSSQGQPIRTPSEFAVGRSLWRRPLIRAYVYVDKVFEDLSSLELVAKYKAFAGRYSEICRKDLTVAVLPEFRLR